MPGAGEPVVLKCPGRLNLIFISGRWENEPARADADQGCTPLFSHRRVHRVPELQGQLREEALAREFEKQRADELQAQQDKEAAQNELVRDYGHWPPHPIQDRHTHGSLMSTPHNSSSGLRRLTIVHCHPCPLCCTGHGFVPSYLWLSLCLSLSPRR